jgi:hypothetical protein
LEQAAARMCEGCHQLVHRFMGLTQQDLAVGTLLEEHQRREWAESAPSMLPFVAEHNRWHVRQILCKRQALCLGPTDAQMILADVIASQAELDATLADGDLVSVP